MRYDFVGYDGSGRPRVTVEAKSRTGTSPEWAAEFRQNLIEHMAPPGDIFAIVTPDRIYTWEAGASSDALPTVTDATPILSPYFERAKVDPERIRFMAFELLVAWWLDDLARAGSPAADRGPARLAEALAGGRIVREEAA